jgi:hypothetical protein
MKSIEETLKPLEGYLISINRDTVNGWYTLQIGLPKDWVFKDNNLIECKELQKTEKGVLLDIVPKEEGVSIDDLIDFVLLVMETNSKIAEKEKEFTDRMNEVKEKLEQQAKEFYGELEDLRKHSFENFGKKGAVSQLPKVPTPPPSQIIKEGEAPKPKRGRGRPPGSKNKPKPQKAERVNE